MGNSESSNSQGYQQVNQRAAAAQQGGPNMQNRNAILKKVQQMYPQINRNELELFANSNRDLVFWSANDPNFEAKVQKCLEKHFTSQENKYGQLIERLYAHRQAQMKEVNPSNQIYSNDQLSDQDMKIIFENASLLEKIDKMKDFFLIKHNNPLQLSLHVTFLANTFKQILEVGEREQEDIYITIVKGYTQFPNTLSKLLCLCGFIEFNEDGKTIGLYYEKRNLSLIKTLYRYIKQKYHTNIKPIEGIIKEISEQNSFRFGSTSYNFDNYQKQQLDNTQISQVQAQQRQQISNQQQQQAYPNQSIPQPNIENQGQGNRRNLADNNTTNNNNGNSSKQMSEEMKQYYEKMRNQNQPPPIIIKVSSNPLYQQISTVVQTKQVQERVKAQIEARQRREELNKKGKVSGNNYQQQQQTQQNSQSSSGQQYQQFQEDEDLLFNENEFVVKTSQQSVGITQFELQDFKPKESQEMRLGRAVAEIVNKYRQQNKLQALEYNDNIYPTCEYHSRNIANQEVQFGHDNFDSRVREISLFADFTLICESVVSSTTPIDCSKVVQELINNEKHKRILLSPTSHICVGTYSKQNVAYLTIIFYKSR